MMDFLSRAIRAIIRATEKRLSEFHQTHVPLSGWKEFTHSGVVTHRCVEINPHTSQRCPFFLQLLLPEEAAQHCFGFVRLSKSIWSGGTHMALSRALSICYSSEEAIAAGTPRATRVFCQVTAHRVCARGSSTHWKVLALLAVDD